MVGLHLVLDVGSKPGEMIAAVVLGDERRICNVLVFFNCTTALATGWFAALVTMPSTVRVVLSSFFC